MIISTKFQVPRLNRLREIARTNRPTDREISKTEQPYFWFWANQLVSVNVGSGHITRFT